MRLTTLYIVCKVLNITNVGALAKLLKMELNI